MTLTDAAHCLPECTAPECRGDTGEYYDLCQPCYEAGRSCKDTAHQLQLYFSYKMPVCGERPSYFGLGAFCDICGISLAASTAEFYRKSGRKISEGRRLTRERKIVHPLIALAAFNLDFLCIHPFRDGNGRVSRLLLLLQTYSLGYEVGRYISLERLIEQNKDRYYETLERSSKTGMRANTIPGRTSTTCCMC